MYDEGFSGMTEANKTSVTSEIKDVMAASPHPINEVLFRFELDGRFRGAHVICALPNGTLADAVPLHSKMKEGIDTQVNLLLEEAGGYMLSQMDETVRNLEDSLEALDTAHQELVRINEEGFKEVTSLKEELATCQQLLLTKEEELKSLSAGVQDLADERDKLREALEALEAKAKIATESEEG